MPMCNLLEYSKSCRKATGSLWNNYRDEPNSGLVGDDNNIIYSIKNSNSQDYKTGITGKLASIDTTKGAEIAVPLKYLSNFWRTLYMALINCEICLTLSWSENCVLTSKALRDAVAAQENNPAVNAINNPTNVTFEIKDTKLYVPVVTLSLENYNKPLEQLKTGLNRTIKQNKKKCQKCLIRLEITI